MPELINNAMQIFPEVHFYNGGLKTEGIFGGKRPDFLPPANQVGPRSTELELKPGEYVTELAFYNHGPKPVIWFGHYVHSVDLAFGPRGNYCGAGVWLVDAIPVYADYLLNFIASVTKAVAVNHQPTPDILDKLRRFTEEFPTLGWTIPFKQMPDAPWKGKLSNFHTLLPDKDTKSLDVAGVDMLARILVAEEPIRHLYITPGNEIKVRTQKPIFSHPQDFGGMLVSHLLKQTPNEAEARATLSKGGVANGRFQNG